MTIERTSFEDIVGLTFSKVENIDDAEIIFTVNENESYRLLFLMLFSFVLFV